MEYCVDHNGTKAAIRAQYSAKSARTTAYRLLKDDEILAEIREEMKKRTRRAGITIDRIIQEQARIAFSNVTDFVAWKNGDVSVIDSDDIDLERSPALQEVSKTDGGTIKIKLHDKLAALNKLAENLGMGGDKKISMDLTSSDGSMSPPTEIMLVGPDYDDDGDEGVSGPESDEDIELG
jgi:phage terminase small subunit